MAMAEQSKSMALDSGKEEEAPGPVKAKQSWGSSPPPFNRPKAAPPRRPSPQEMIDYYRKKGLEKQAATEKVIDDLQKALTVAVAVRSGKVEEAENSLKTIAKNAESMSSRLSSMEAKLNSKPGVGEVFAAGVVAGGFLQCLPHVFRATLDIGRSLKGATSSQP